MLCANCRSSSYYWKKQTLPHMRQRRQLLGLFSSRLEYYNPRVAELVNDAQKKVAAIKRHARTAETVSHAMKH